MTNARREQHSPMNVLLAAAIGLGLTATACTPATPDPPPGMTGAGTGGNVAGATGGSSGSAGSGGSVGSSSGGATGSGGVPVGSSGGSVGTGGSVGSGGAPTSGSGGANGSGGAVGRGGSIGSGGAVGTGGSAATGCNWVTAADGTIMFGPPPATKIVLFDGTNLSQWHSRAGVNVPAQWLVLNDGSNAMEVVPQPTPTDIQTNMKFDDLCVHVEYMTPVFPSTATTQQQGNSGVYLKSAYEMQILDTHNSPPLIDGCGAVYLVAPPLVVACNMFLVWNTYEIEFKSSGWDASGNKVKDAVFATVALNGKLVQKNVSLNPPGGFTQAGIADAPGPQPLLLQDHRDRVRFRNVWVYVPH